MHFNFNVACINQCTELEGPYKRLAIWFQGCRRRCKGCCNPELQELTFAHIISERKLIDIILRAKEKFGIEGVTFLGGEPLLQKGINSIAKQVHTRGLGTILFTGYKYESIVNIEGFDLIIDGEFLMDQKDNKRNLIGSTNQRIFDITGRYSTVLEWFYQPREKSNEVNFADSCIYFNGDVLMHNSDN